MKSTLREIEEIFYGTLAAQLEGRSRPFRITAAYSGGPDSALLLYLLHKFSKDFGYTLDAAHVNHGIRSEEEMREEEECVIKNTKQLSLTLHNKKLSPGFLEFYARRKHCGTESAARTFRYGFFNRILDASGGDHLLALGHNRNDQEETIIMRLFTGAGLEGLKGIPEKSDKLIRPLIGLGRSEILTALDELQIPYVHDSSNSETVYLRNRIRLNLMDPIQDVFPRAGSSLLRLGRDTAAVLDHYYHLLDAACPWSEGVGEGEFSCKTEDFLRMPPVSRRAVILRLMNTLLQGDFQENRIPRQFFQPLEKPAFPEGILLKGYNILFLSQDDRLVLKKSPVTAAPENLFFVLKQDHPYFSDRFTLTLVPSGHPLPEGGEILFSLEGDSALLRTPYSAAEGRPFRGNQDRSVLFIQGGGDDFAVIDSFGESLATGRAGQKRSEFASKTGFQCVIIKGRGDYAPGKQQQ